MRHAPLLLVLSIASLGFTEDAIQVGSRRELLVDDALIASMKGLELRLQKPVPREVALTCDAPWEGNTSAYYTIFLDGDVIRAYYRASHVDEKKKATHRELTCYAESRDGLTFTKPKLGLIEFNGSKDNNIIWAGPEGTHNFSPFRDSAADCKPEARYKALAGGTTMVKGKKKSCLHAYQSADGIHWSELAKAVITDGAFDSQNIAFYDEVRGEYRAYWRYFSKGYTDERGWKPEGVRAIRTATSKDFIHWEHQADLRYGDAPPEHLYTNAIRCYERAPELFIGFPTRFQPKHEQVEPVFMSSRDGVNFKRWPEELIPITAPKDRDGNRSNYMTRGLVMLPGQDRELSVYATEAYYAGPGSKFRRFVFRTDGFVAAHAQTQGELVTKPIIFQGSTLKLNIVSRGASRVALQEADGKAIPGFDFDDCTVIKGDEIDLAVSWKGGDVSKLAGKPVRLAFSLNDADLFAWRFAVP